MPCRSNQTISYLCAAVCRGGHSAQHAARPEFSDRLEPAAAARRAGPTRPRDVVLEVGTGTGALTAMMAPQRGGGGHGRNRSTAVSTGQRGAVRLSKRRDAAAGRAARTRATSIARLIAAVRSTIGGRAGSAVKLVANLPYSVATPVIANLLPRRSCRVDDRHDSKGTCRSHRRPAGHARTTAR